MPFNINEMKTNLQYGGARPNLFDVQINFPSSVANLDTKFKVQAAQIPPATLGIIQVPYFGRFLKLAGDRTYPGWQVNIINDEDFTIRNAMELWSNAINELVGNKRKKSASQNSYKTTALVTQYGKTGDPIRQYEFVGIFPAQVGDIALDWSNVDQIELFPVLFEYDYWVVKGGDTGTLTGSTIGDVGGSRPAPPPGGQVLV